MVDKDSDQPGAGPENNEESDPRSVPGDAFPIVGVGASAGGLEAFRELLQNLPSDTGMAVVVIQHLAPNHQSMLPQLLGRATSMPVNQAEDGTVISPNQAYVIPPNATMTVAGNTLVLRPRENAATAVDVFLRSLAASKKTRAIAVILSGSGSDGALGVQAIAEEGGIVFAQEPESAKFDGMPRSAIATGCVDFVLKPVAIASELSRIASEPRLIKGEDREQVEESSDSQNDFRILLRLLQATTGIDFSLYRQATVWRRLLRRLALIRLTDLGTYVKYVKENPDELHALAQDILIRVTHFFRDPGPFEALSRRVFPALIRRTSPDDAVRIWVPGTATGEEAYSIAICFLEVAAQMQSRVPLQVFATDINDAAIAKARRGVYIDNIAADVSPERLARFFVRIGKEYQVSRKLRGLCVFSRHDLLNDPPFSRMGLISCRNVLIYLDSIQREALSRFHFALNPGGFLLLGKSETVASSPGLFTPLDREARLYARQESVKVPVSAYPGRKKPAFPTPPSVDALRNVRQPRPLEVRRQADLLLVERYGPARVIINEGLELVSSGGDLAPFLKLDGELRPDSILPLLPEAATEALKGAVEMARRVDHPIKIEGVKLSKSAHSEATIEVTSLGPDRQHFLITFAYRQPELRESGQEGRNESMRVSRLETELASSRANLESIIVEQEATNEEVVATNEELQSLNEELESAKEELEATNEELSTVNQELQVRNVELETAREFAQATLDTVRGSLLVLGSDLRVLKANRTFFRTFRLSPEEVENRFIYELGEGLFAVPKLRVLLEEILPENRTMEDFEVENSDASRGQRTLLLNARRFDSEHHILLAIEDVTAAKNIEAGLRQSQKMEAIGYLAAGVAHDFNNLLTGVIGNTSLVLESLPQTHAGRSLLRDAISGGERAADLTRQLLAYAGKGRFYMERVRLSELVMQTGKLLHHSIPTNVQLRLDLDNDLPLLLADPSQLQQVVMNLVINGVEAIGDAEGTVLVKTGLQTVTDQPLPGLFPGDKLSPGEHIFLEVSDNGSGMDKQTIRRIFDPFFTTKFMGRGLGLAAVLGIIRQHKGGMQIHSVPGRGSSFRVLLCPENQAPSQLGDDSIVQDLRGTGTVLVVDDEAVIRNFMKMALESYGYEVLLAQDGAEAVRLFQGRPTEIGLVLLDFAMPGMDGVETLRRLRAVRQNLPAVVCSTFGDVEVAERFEGLDVAAFFAKPFTVKQLAKKVKECISAGNDRPQADDVPGE